MAETSLPGEPDPAASSLFAEALPHHVWTAGRAGRFEYFNSRALDFFGVTREQLSTLDWGTIVHPDDLTRVLSAWRSAVSVGQPYEVEYRMRDRRTGEFRWFATRAVAQREPDGTIRRWYGTNTDIENQKRAEQAAHFLAESGAILGASLDFEKTLADVARLAVPHIADWCSVDMLDEHGGFRRVAVAHVDPTKVALAHELWRRMPPRADDPTGVAQVVRTGQPDVLRDIPDEMLTAVIKDPEILAVIRALGLRSSITVPLTALGKTQGALTLVTAESGRRYGDDDVALALEIGRRAALAIENARLFDQTRRLLRERDEAMATLEQRVAERTQLLTEANRELEAFTYTVSHDLRAPIRHISGFADLLHRNAAAVLDETGQRYLRTIGTAARQMGTLIDALLGFSRMGRGELKRTTLDTDALVRDVVRELEPDVQGRSIEFRIGKLPRISGDAATLKLVFGNLIANAVKYTRPRANAVVEVGESSGEADTSADEVTLFVRDNGVGFNPDYVHKLFGVFQRLHSDAEFEGTGIGLATVRRIVQRHGGRVRAEGKPDAGATFYITLPRAVA